MIKEWATVVSWQNGLRWSAAMLKPPAAAALPAGCGSRVLNKLGRRPHTPSRALRQPLMPGKKWNWALPKAACSVRRCWSICLRWWAVLMAALFQVLFGTDLAALCGAVLGAWADSGCARSLEACRTRRVAAGHSQRCAAARSYSRRNALLICLRPGDHWPLSLSPPQNRQSCFFTLSLL
jgi:sigma-E factor negative regulatory protein RseC